jgi:hypothetical protein
MIGGDAQPHVWPASRAESAYTSPVGAALASAAATPPKVAECGARRALLSRPRAGLELTAFQNFPLGARRALPLTVLGPTAAPLSP